MSRSLRRAAVVVVSIAAIAVAVVACGGGHHGGAARAPVLVSVTPGHATVDASVLLTGSNFGATQGASTVDFGGTVATIVSWSSHQIVATVPPTVFPGPAAVTVTVKAQTATQPFTVVLPDAVYVDDNDSTNAATNAIEGFAISSAGVLTAMPGSPWKLGERARSYGGDAQTIRVDAAHRRLYVSGYDFVHPFDIDPQTGVLTARTPVFVQGSGTLGLGLVPGRELFTTDCDTNKVGAFVIDSAGSLTPAPGSPYPLADGRGTPIIAYPVRGGQFLWELGGTLADFSGWSVQPNGSLVPLVVDSHLESSSAEIFGGVVSPAGDRILLPAFGTSQLIMLDVDAAGELSDAPGSPLALPFAPNGTAFSADGARAFAAKFDGNVVYAYDVGVNGAIGMVGSALDTHFAGMTSMATDSYDRWLVVADEPGQTVGIFSIAGPIPVAIGNNVNLVDITANASGIAVTP